MHRTIRKLGRTPLTDPRSLSSSVGFHGAVLLGTSLLVLQSILPVPESDSVPAIYGEVGPVDNRAVDSGGGPGELGGTLTPEQVRIAADGAVADSRSLPDPTADALLEEILPTQTAPDPDARALPGPLATGVGVIPGPGFGGGGGDGGGSGGGEGRGLGPGTEFFGARDRAESFVYVIDRSASMTNRNSFEIAKRELIASLRRLPADARFGVVFYNERSTTFDDPDGQARLMPADSRNKTRLEDRLMRMGPDGGTNHLDALRVGFKMKPEVIFFLTDADLMTPREAEMLAREAGSIRIQAIEFGVGPDSGLSVPLRTLANATGGMYRYIDVMRFPLSLGR